MIGSIIGDIIGSKYEFNNLKNKEFPLFSDESRFTDDSVMTIAVYKAFKEANGDYSHIKELLVENMQNVGKKYISCGYGGMFYKWINSDKPAPYNSFGNGSAMRVSGVVEFASSLIEAMEFAGMETEYYYDTQNEKVVMLFDGMVDGEDNPELFEDIKEGFVEDYIPLPGQSREEVPLEDLRINCMT